jgi:hypothetical protein
MDTINKQTKKQKSNLARTAIYILEKVDKSKFIMQNYSSNEYGEDIIPKDVKKNYNECGTTCCFAGHGPISLPYSAKDSIYWNRYVEKTYGIEEGSGGWEFLFGPEWSDNTKQAASRALKYLKGEMPEDFENKEIYYKSFSNKKLIEKLNAFV